MLFIRGVLRNHMEPAAENLARRRQLAALGEKTERPRLRNRGGTLWALLPRVWPNWRSPLLIVRHDAVVPPVSLGIWLFSLRTGRSSRVARLRTQAAIKELIGRMSRENPGWGLAASHVSKA